MRVGWEWAILAAVVLPGCLESMHDLPLAASNGFASDATLLLSEPLRAQGHLTHEPAIAQGLDGVLFVAGSDYGDLPADLLDSPALWKSRDEGRTWSLVATGNVLDRAIGNSDVDLAVGLDGVLYFATMTFTGLGHSIAVGASPDGGTTWTWTIVSTQPFADRPWVDVAPDGGAHIIWNDGIVVHHAHSADRGKTWLETTPAHARGGDGGLAIGPNGELAVRIIPTSGSGWTNHDGQDGVAVSTDGGLTWTFRPVPGMRKYAAGLASDPKRWADPVAFDVEGVLCTAWGEGSDLKLARSNDLGATWEQASLADHDGMVWFPWLRSGSLPGELAVTWFTNAENGTDYFTRHVAHITGADTAVPLVVAATFPPDTPPEQTGGEYFPVLFLQGGGLGVATTLFEPQGAVGFVYRSAMWDPSIAEAWS